MLVVESQFKRLTKEDLSALREARMSSFDPDYWNKHVRNSDHYDLVVDSKFPIDYRLLYDSWLWRKIFENECQSNKHSNMLELLPGPSLTIPMALQSFEFQGKLFRLDHKAIPELPKTIKFENERIWNEFMNLEKDALSYDVIVGNHILDDLLFSFYIPNSKTRERIYLDQKLCKSAWESMIIEGHKGRYQIKLARVFSNIVNRMRQFSTLIIRHYPSTFALTSNDHLRVNAEMETLFLVAKAISELRNCTVFFVDDAHLIVAPGSKYPNGVLVVHRH